MEQRIDLTEDIIVMIHCP